MTNTLDHAPQTPVTAPAMTGPTPNKATTNSVSTLDFLTLILPDTGVYYLGVMQKGRHGVGHRAFTSLDEMAAAVAKYDRNPDVTVYHACASYKEPFVVVGEGDDAKKKYRIPSNTLAAKAFWADLDVGEKKAEAGKGYPTKRAAAEAIIGFCKQVDFPAPMLVDSGNGVHCYWPLMEPILADDWRALAEQFKSVLAHFGVLADPTRTADFASILRPPGSHNKKDPASHKPVSVKNTVTPSDASVLAAKLDNIISTYNVSVAPTGPRAAGLNYDLLVHAYPDIPCSGVTLADQCKQVALVRDGVDTSYEHWRGVIGVLAHCNANGHELAHQWSSKSAQYSEQETEQKYTTWSAAPTTCAHLERHNAGGCDGCVHKGAIKSPIGLGRPVTAAAPSPTTNTALQSLQQNYALANIGGRIGVIDIVELKAKQKIDASGALTVMQMIAGKVIAERHLVEHFPQADRRACFNQFLVDKATTIYNSVAFTPSAVDDKTLNLWVGPTLTPATGSWPVLRKFLHADICAGDDVVFTYLTNYLAHALQRPEEKPGVMLTLIGGQGTGKGAFFSIIQKIWGATTLSTASIDHVVGGFNASLEGSMWVLLDEAVFAGDRRAADTLKSLVTGPTVRINPKNQPQRTIQSVHRFAMATNHLHAAHREYDDRRDLTLSVSETNKGNSSYWGQVYASINTETPALMHDLMGFDLSKFNVREKPDTAALIQQKIKSLPVIEEWWYNCLYNGAIGQHRDWPTFIGTEVARGLIKDFAHGSRSYREITSDAVITALRKVCPQTKQEQRTVNYNRVRGSVIPSLDQCRAAFERYIGGEVEW